MSNDHSDAANIALLLFAVLVVIALCLIPVYRANLQADAYHRQGINISTWEVFMGVKPAETVIQIKETK